MIVNLVAITFVTQKLLILNNKTVTRFNFSELYVKRKKLNKINWLA